MMSQIFDNSRFCICIVFLLLCPGFVYGNVERNTLKKVSVQLQWKNQFEYAGFYIAKEKGYYKDIGLDVEIREWENEINIPESVASGGSDYGVARPSVLINISKGLDLVLLAALYQSNPLIVLADKSSGIDSIDKFKGKRIMITEDHILDSSLVAMFNSQGVKVSDMHVVKHSFDPKSLLDGETDLMAAYISNEPLVLEELGGEPVIFSSKDYGFDFYNDILIVARKYLEENPEEVRNFTEATLKGFEYAFSHIGETVSLIYEKYNSLNKSKEALLREAKELKKVAYHETSDIGNIDLKRLEKIYDVYKLFGLASVGVNLYRIVYGEISSKTELSLDEREFLLNRKINVCISPEWNSPFYEVDSKGNPIGIGVDYVKLLKKKFNIDFVIQKTSSWTNTIELFSEEKCDMLPLAIKTREKRELMSFTTPYLQFPILVTTRKDVSFINGAADLGSKPVAILKDHYLKYFFKEKNYNLNIREVENIEEGFEMVSDGKIFAFIDSLPNTIFALQNSQYNKNLKVSGKLLDDLAISAGVKTQGKKIFHIIQKCFDSITPQEKQEIKDKWFPVNYDARVNYAFVVRIVAAIFIILIILLYWNRKVVRLNKVLQESKLEIERTNNILREVAIKDRLTQLYNRLKIDELLQSEIDKAVVKGESFGICLLDVDYFKKINDTYGHQIGDETLIMIAKSIQTNTRESDFVGRWGGEEFLIISPAINEQNLEVLAEKIRQKVKGIPFEWFGPVTVSLGITMFQCNDTVKSLIKRADKALYQAKDNGRDCVVKL